MSEQTDVFPEQPDGADHDLSLVLAGADRPPYPLRGRMLRIGRSAANDIVLEDRYVSSTHCEVRDSGDAYEVRDLGSRNGTLLNGLRVDRGLLALGARLRLGQTEIVCLRTSPRRTMIATGGLAGSSRAMRAIVRDLVRCAQREAPVLILGETGTGKELAARALHQLSPRRRGPFVPVNCGALLPELAMSELVGHERGSFTGAASIHRGAFEQADGGTLLLDEVGELEPRVQAALLRVLENGTVRRVGAEQDRPVSVRIVAATNRDLKTAVSAQRFRSDLYHRLAVLCITMPPLRARLEDLPEIAEALLARNGSTHSISQEALELLAQHRWPGNVRELRNVLERACAVAVGERIDARHIVLESIDGTLLGDDRDSLLGLLARHGGSVASAARALGVPRTTLRDRIQRHRLSVP